MNWITGWQVKYLAEWTLHTCVPVQLFDAQHPCKLTQVCHTAQTLKGYSAHLCACETVQWGHIQARTDYLINVYLGIQASLSLLSRPPLRFSAGFAKYANILSFWNVSTVDTCCRIAQLHDYNKKKKPDNTSESSVVLPTHIGMTHSQKTSKRPIVFQCEIQLPHPLPPLHISNSETCF